MAPVSADGDLRGIFACKVTDSGERYARTSSGLLSGASQGTVSIARFFAMNAGLLKSDSRFGYAFKKLTAYNSKG